MTKPRRTLRLVEVWPTFDDAHIRFGVLHADVRLRAHAVRMARRDCLLSVHLI